MYLFTYNYARIKTYYKETYRGRKRSGLLCVQASQAIFQHHNVGQYNNLTSVRE